MKTIKLILTMLVLLGVMLANVRADDTTNNLLAKPYEQLTASVLKNIKQEGDNLMAWRTTDRGSLTRFWLQYLNHINQMHDTKFDLENITNMPMSNVAPPFDPTNPISAKYPSGIDPKAIQEPDYRAAYEKLLEQNHEKYLRFNFEFMMQRYAKFYSDEAVGYFAHVYQKTPADAKELMAEVDAIADDSYKAELKTKLSEFVELANAKTDSH